VVLEQVWWTLTDKFTACLKAQIIFVNSVFLLKRIKTECPFPLIFELQQFSVDFVVKHVIFT
jgi:hypothetical protein